jgi:hypothetical protein
MKKFFIFISLFIIGTIILIFTLKIIDNKSNIQSVACTMEAKLCPDGSYVGRTGPNCEFSICPSSTTTSEGTGILQGTVTIGPICPVEQIGHPCLPTPEMYASHQVLVYNSDRTKIITSLIPNSQGGFSTTLPVGNYLIDVQHQSVGFVGGVPSLVNIMSNQTVTLTISIDTGIR